MNKNEEIIFKIKEVLPQKGERTKTLAGKISSLLIQLPELVKYIDEKNPELNKDIFYDLGRYIDYHRFTKGKIIQHIAQGDNYFYMIVTGKAAKIGIKYKKSNMSFKEYILHLTKLQLLDEYFLMSDSIEKNKEIFPFKLEKNMIKLFQQIQNFDFDKELKKIIKKIQESKWAKEHEDINDFLELINPEFLYGKEYFLSKDMKFPILIPHYIKKEILGPNSFIGYLFKSKGIKELSTYICINNSDVLYIDKSVFPPGCRLINIFEQKFNYSLINNIFKRYIIFENISINYLTKYYSNYFRLVHIKKGEKLVIQGTPHEGIYFINKGQFQLRTFKSYYELQELIFSLRDSLDTFTNYISFIKKREFDDLNNKGNDQKNIDMYKNPLFVIKSSEKKDIIFATYHAPKIIGLNEFYDIKTGINHFSLYCQSDDAEIYFLPSELFYNLLSIDSVYKIIAHMVEERVDNLIFGIKRYKSLYEADFLKYFSLPKITNNNNSINNNEIIDKKNLNFSNILQSNNHESKNTSEEENNLKKYNIIPQINSEIINQPKYNIIKKKLFNFSRKRNRLNNSLKNDSLDVFSFVNLKENRISSTKNQNKSISYLENKEKIKKFYPLNHKLPKVRSQNNIKKNLFDLINKNNSVDKNISIDKVGYSPERRIFNLPSEKSKILNLKEIVQNKDNHGKIKLKSIPNIKINLSKSKPLANDNSKNEESSISSSEVEDKMEDIKESKEKEKEQIKENANKLINELNKKRMSLNVVENIYNNYSYNINQKKILMLNGKNITFRNSLANINDIAKFNSRFSVKPIIPLNLVNNIIPENIDKKE